MNLLDSSFLVGLESGDHGVAFAHAGYALMALSLPATNMIDPVISNEQSIRYLSEKVVDLSCLSFYAASCCIRRENCLECFASRF